MKRRPIILIAALFVLPLVASGQSNSSRLSAKQLIKAERLVAQLQQLDDFLNSGPSSTQYKARMVKLSDALNQTAGSLPEGDTKTDLATALYWYEQLSQDFSHSFVSRSPSVPTESFAWLCTSERPGVYQKLCEN